MLLPGPGRALIWIYSERRPSWAASSLMVCAISSKPTSALALVHQVRLLSKVLRSTLWPTQGTKPPRAIAATAPIKASPPRRTRDATVKHRIALLHRRSQHPRGALRPNPGDGGYNNLSLNTPEQTR